MTGSDYAPGESARITAPPIERLTVPEADGDTVQWQL
jgi:hypothetical protein